MTLGSTGGDVRGTARTQGGPREEQVRTMSGGGFIAPGFEAVEEAFAGNFKCHGEVGAAFCAVQDGVVVVDLWGGLASKAATEDWRKETAAVVFSGTKGWTALCLVMLIDRGELELDAPVTHYWPEFGAAGKGHISVSEIVSHRARLPGFKEPLSAEDLLHDVQCAERLAAQAPERDPRAASCYHPLTWGWLCGELVRRITGRSIGQFFVEEIAGPIDLDMWIGARDERVPHVATLELHTAWASSPRLEPSALAADDLLWSVWGNPPVFLRDTFAWNRTDFHRAEIPGAGGIATARSIARLYGCLAEGGFYGSGQIVSERALVAARQPLATVTDVLSGAQMAVGTGFALQGQKRPLGPPPDGFGHGGAGGSIHGAWPSQHVGFSYVMNLMRDDQPADPRAQALLAALYSCARRISSHRGRKRVRADARVPDRTGSQ